MYAKAPFVPTAWQEQWLREVFGALRPDGMRQYRTAYLEIPKKNGKTTLIAGVLAKMLYDDGEFGAEVYSAAATREQAGMTYQILASMVRQCPRLLKVDGRPVKLYDRDKRIYIPSTESFFQALSADADYNDGINPSAAVIDELHRHRNGDLLAVIDEGMGTRSQPLLCVITTAGGVRVGVCWDWHESARKIIEGIEVDSSFHATIYAADEKADIMKEKTWLSCNPALRDGILKLEDFRQAARKAASMPTAELNFRRLRLNQWVAHGRKWLNRVHWNQCGGLMPRDDELLGRVCYGGIDLGETDDLSAWAKLFPWQADDPRVETFGAGYDLLVDLWMPEAAVQKRRQLAPQLRRWAKAGFIHIVSGDSMDHEIVYAKVIEDADRYDIQDVGYDPWKMKQLAMRLEEQGVPMTPVRMSPQTMSEPCKELELLLAKKRFNHGGNPALRWMADNAAVKVDPSGNIRPDKSTSAEKIDGIVASVIALERAMRVEVQPEIAFYSFAD
jgi:phage terminase large subunit-like protein